MAWCCGRRGTEESGDNTDTGDDTDTDSDELLEPEVAEDLLTEIQDALGSERRPCPFLLSRFLFWWQHPGIRIVAPLYVLGTDLFMHAADPASSAHSDWAVPFMGEIWNFLMPPFLPQSASLPAWGHLLKLFLNAFILILAACAFPMALSKIPGFRCMCPRGTCSWLVPLMSWIMLVLTAALTWNLVLYLSDVDEGGRYLQYGQNSTPYMTQFTGISDKVWNKMIETFVFVLDIAGLAMVADTVLQDGSRYPQWSKLSLCGRKFDLRKWWTEDLNGQFRVAVIWITVLSCTVLAMIYTWSVESVITNYETDDEGIGQLWNTKQFFRANIFASQFFFDTVTVLQDWDFPTFENPFGICVFGFNYAFGGRAANYAIIFTMGFVDLKATMSTIFYVPFIHYMQYTDKTSHLWAIRDQSIIGSHDNRKRSAYDFFNREENGCFDKPKIQDMIDSGCVKKGPDEATYVKDVPGWMYHGRNACCDKRLVVQWTVDDMEGRSWVPWLWILITPPVSILLAVVMYYSQIEMCRKTMLDPVVHAHQELTQGYPSEFGEITNDESDGDKGITRATSKGSQVPRRSRGSIIHVDQDFIEKRNKIMELVQNKRMLKKFIKNTVQKEASGLSAIDEESASGESVSFRRPAVPQEDKILLVTSSGVYGVNCGGFAQIHHLKSALFRQGLGGGLPQEKIVLRMRPLENLKDSLVLCQLLTLRRKVCCLYVQSRQRELEPEVDGLESFMWLSRGLRCCCWDLPERLIIQCTCCRRKQSSEEPGYMDNQTELTEKHD